MLPMRPALIALTLLLFASSVAPAFAQEDGVFYDDDDAAGKEYAIPGEDARREGSGGNESGGSGPSNGSGSSPNQGGTTGADTGSDAFGEGVSKAESDDPNGRAESGVAGANESSASGDTAGSSLGATHTTGDVGEAATPALWSAGLAFALLAAAGVAWMVRRRRTSASA